MAKAELVVPKSIPYRYLLMAKAKGERSYGKMFRNKTGMSKVLRYNVHHDDGKSFAMPDTITNNE
jgi:hypothetical protein